VNVDGSIVSPSGYLDEFDIRRAKRFLNHTSPKRPWYIWFADTYPHSPYVPRTKYANEQIPPPPGTETPALAETNVSDKPSFVQAQYGRQLGVDQTLENELRMLRTVDDHFRAIVAKLRQLGELRNTMIVFVSDNGYLFGEHGLWGKAVPYPEATNVPMMIRYPHHQGGGTRPRRHAQNVDLAPTVLHTAGVHPKLVYRFDGRALQRRWSRPVVLTESLQPIRDSSPQDWQPPWRSITTRGYQYTEWHSDGNIIAREYYDLADDPYELANLLGDGNPANDPDVAALHLLLRHWARCAGVNCR
jgi:arylsulfatase A-like enzyme